jgi:hypothetical protein
MINTKSSAVERGGMSLVMRMVVVVMAIFGAMLM